MNEDARLMHWLSSHRGEAGTSADPSAHVDLDTLTRHATGRLPPAQAQAITEHLLVCDDARCVAFVRTQASDVDAASDFLYPPGDERASSPRTFQCKEVLWSMIEEVAQHTGLPVDEVLNDAMLQYAHSRGYHEGPTARRPGEVPSLEVTQDAAAFARRSSDALRAGSITATAVREDDDLSESEPSARSRSAHPSITAQRSPALTPEAVPRAPQSVRSPAARPMAMPASMPRMPSASAPPPPPRAPAHRTPLAPPPPRSASLAPPSSRRAPPPLPSTPHMPLAAPAASMGMPMGSMSLAKRLVLTYLGQTYDVDKEHFILGRSKGQADLRIDDANVSRQHAAIERIGSIFYLVDLGSTNGVYVGTDRVTRRALADGDTIVITSHRITCKLG